MTVTLLAVGLFAAGMGTQAFLRNTLTANLDATLQQAVTTDIASTVFDIATVDGVLTVTVKDAAPPTGTIVAVYAPPEGDLRGFADGTASLSRSSLPAQYPLEKAASQGTTPFALEDDATGADFRASVYYIEASGGTLFTQLVAQPLAPTERVVAAFVGIYSILALLILFASALLTRWLVTLTFRGLGQVEATAMSIAAGDFGQRLADVVPGTEVGRLKFAINTMLGRVDAAIRQRDATVRQMRRFIGDASHELRTPLVTVRGYAELYRMGAIRSDDDVAQAMERIEKEAIRMGVLVEDLLALARLDERRDVELTPIDLRPLARDAALDLRATSPLREVTVDDTTLGAPPFGSEQPAPPVEPAERQPDIVAEPPTLPTPATTAAGGADAGRRRTSPATSAIAIAGATISRLRRRPRADDPTGSSESAEAELTTTPPVAPVVLGEENRIRQVIANLLGNARRFTTDDSPIGLRVGSDAETGMGWIEIIDHGEGIPEQIREQIFERFWRADTSRTRETGGSGLGLSIVASIVETLHGRVSVVDTPGGGATFRVALPLAEAAPAAAAAE